MPELFLKQKLRYNIYNNRFKLNKLWAGQFNHKAVIQLKNFSEVKCIWKIYLKN